MFDPGQLKACAARKAALLSQSAAHRRVLTTEARRLKPMVQWVDIAVEWSKKIKAGYSVLGPLMDALWRPATTGGIGSVIQKVRGLLSMAKSLSALWTQRR